MHHLRLGDAREWDEFPEQAEAAALVLPFDASANRNERTLRLRHRDLKQSWCVRVNGRDVACLPPDEADTISYLAVPPDTLRDGRNELRISSGGTAPDDVLIGEVTVIDRPRAEVMTEATVDVSVHERPGGSGGAEPHHGGRRARHAGVARQRDGRDARGEAGRGLQRHGRRAAAAARGPIRDLRRTRLRVPAWTASPWIWPEARRRRIA